MLYLEAVCIMRPCLFDISLWVFQFGGHIRSRRREERARQEVLNTEMEPKRRRAKKSKHKNKIRDWACSRNINANCSIFVPLVRSFSFLTSILKYSVIELRQFVSSFNDQKNILITFLSVVTLEGICYVLETCCYVTFQRSGIQILALYDYVICRSRSVHF